MSMKMAKASAQDLDAAMSISQALEAISGQWFSTMPEAIEKPPREGESERFDIDNPEHCRRVIEHLQQLTRSASLFRVVMGMHTVLSPRNKCVDPDADTIEHHPERLADAKDAARYRSLRRGQHWSVVDGIGDTLRAEALDAAIDAAEPTKAAT